LWEYILKVYKTFISVFWFIQRESPFLSTLDHTSLHCFKRVTDKCLNKTKRLSFPRPGYALTQIKLQWTWIHRCH
jgi:hypothetical protein